ncbi:hypothetical protein M134_3907 [Bacteroides fragilis str. S24L34]|nr:hypothetical protein M134_3907 [Bacteroides fragilis str. S24L34]
MKRGKKKRLTLSHNQEGKPFGGIPECLIDNISNKVQNTEFQYASSLFRIGSNKDWDLKEPQ